LSIWTRNEQRHFLLFGASCVGENIFSREITSVGLYVRPAFADSPDDENWRIAANMFLVSSTNRTSESIPHFSQMRTPGQGISLFARSGPSRRCHPCSETCRRLCTTRDRQNTKNIVNDHRTVVLISTGVGVIPLLSMLHHLVALNGDTKADTDKE
jgi:hypothetical protein